jgi:hypothetical protein
MGVVDYENNESMIASIHNTRTALRGYFDLHRRESVHTLPLSSLLLRYILAAIEAR